MLGGESMVRAWPFKHLLEVVQGTLGGLLTTLVVGSVHERALALLLLLLLVVGTVEAPSPAPSSRFALPLRQSKITPTASSPEAWLVATSRSSLVVHGPLRPSL